MEAANKLRLEETRSQLADCGYERTHFKEYNLENLKSIEWWVANEEIQVLIWIGDHFEFNLFLYLGNEVSSVSNLQTIATIAFSKRL